MPLSFEQLKSFYTDSGWPIEEVPNQPILSVTYGSKVGNFVFVASVHVATQTMTMFARAPLTCPTDRQGPVLAFFNRANFGATHGTWTLDPSDGEIRFRVGADVGDMEIPALWLQRVTLYTLQNMEQFLPALKAVVAGEQEPLAAYQAALS